MKQVRTESKGSFSRTLGSGTEFWMLSADAKVDKGFVSTIKLSLTSEGKLLVRLK